MTDARRSPSTLLVVIVLALAAPAARAADGPDPVREKIASTLRELLGGGGDAGPGAAAGRNAIPLVATGRGAGIDVEIEVAGSAEADRATLEAAGARIGLTAGSRADARVALADLLTVAALPRVVAVRRPIHAIPHVTSQGVELTHADTMHRAGFTGRGIKIGILDQFNRYDEKLGGELPPSERLVFRSFLPGGGTGGDDHGVKVAEIVHDMAPDASLYLVAVDTYSSLVNGANYLFDQGVQVINMSLGYGLLGDGKGNGPINEVAQFSDLNNIVFVCSAGNSAQSHWKGRFTDANGNGELEFAPGVERLPFNASRTDEITVMMRWDDWQPSVNDPRPTNDFDLCLYDASGHEVTCARDPQNGKAGQLPLEFLQHIPAAPGTMSLGVKKVHGGDLDIELLLAAPDYSFGALAVPAGSIVVPADSAEALTAGATDLDDALEPFSSRGPTVDGRIKPDLTGPDRTDTSLEGGFTGTSASAPHVTGAVALLRQQSPALTAAEARERLRQNAVDAHGDGTPGPDSNFGYGRLCADFVNGCPAPTPTPRSGGGGGGGCRLADPESPAQRLELLGVVLLVVLYAATAGRRT